MRYFTVALLVVAFTTLSCATSDGFEATRSCSEAALPAFPDVRIVSVSAETDFAPHCKVAGVIGAETNFELLLPDDWNGKFAMGGGGGFVGTVVNFAAAKAGALEAGYASVGTDGGHQGHPLDGSWALHNQERVVSFGHQAVHRTAVTARALTSAYYGRDASRNYFIGCSTGGRQALMEAQRYPDDFDGIVAGSPAFDFTNEVARYVWANQAMYPDSNDLSQPLLGREETELIGKAVLDQCDGLDGLNDGILANPLACEFDVSFLACDRGSSGPCLTAKQLNAAKRIYEGPRDRQGQIFPGVPPGGELSPNGWATWITGGAELTQRYRKSLPSSSQLPVPNMSFALSNGLMKYLVYNDPDWNYADYSFQNFRSDSATTAATVNATDPDLSAFRERGGKLLMFTGWGDMALSPLRLIDYYGQVLEHDASAAEDVRLLMLPGVDHCFGGLGPDQVSYLEILDEWVETRDAPTQATAAWDEARGQGSGSRLICAYPSVLTYDGSGDPRTATSFSCQNPGRERP